MLVVSSKELHFIPLSTQKVFEHITLKKCREVVLDAMLKNKPHGSLWIYSHPTDMKSRSGFPVGLSQKLTKSF